MTISELIHAGKWEEFFLDTKTGEKFPKNNENVQNWLDNKPETKYWSSVSQVKK